MFSTVVIGKDGVSGSITFSDLTEAEHYQWLVNMGIDTDVCGHTIAWCVRPTQQRPRTTDRPSHLALPPLPSVRGACGGGGSRRCCRACQTERASQ